MHLIILSLSKLVNNYWPECLIIGMSAASQMRKLHPQLCPIAKPLAVNAVQDTTQYIYIYVLNHSLIKAKKSNIKQYAR